MRLERRSLQGQVEGAAPGQWSSPSVFAVAAWTATPLLATRYSARRPLYSEIWEAGRCCSSAHRLEMRLLFVGCRREGCRRIFDDAFLAMVKARDQGGASRSGGNEGDNDTHVQFLTKKKPPRGARPLLFQTPNRKPIPGRRAKAINQVLAKGLICAGISSAFPARERIDITGTIIGGLLADLLMFRVRAASETRDTRVSFKHGDDCSSFGESSLWPNHPTT